jgi:thiamine-monophosphate kinase
VAAGLGDDAATLEVPPGEQLVVSSDCSVEDVHFRRAWFSGHEIGYRAAMAALSDLAAMGASPLGITLVLAFPPAQRHEIEAVADGIAAAARETRCRILGGDLSRAAALFCSVTVLGSAPHPVRRAGARVGDALFVTGTLGAPGAALRALNAGDAPSAGQRARFARPQARLREGRWAAAHGASAMIDISDGLVSDAAHLAAAGGVGLTIDLDRLPVVQGVTAAAAAGSGEEYELLFAAASDLATGDFEREVALSLTRIGEVAAAAPGGRVTFVQAGRRVDLAPGHDHFSP